MIDSSQFFSRLKLWRKLINQTVSVEMECENKFKQILEKYLCTLIQLENETYFVIFYSIYKKRPWLDVSYVVMELELFISWPPSWPGSNWQSLLSLSLPVTPRHFLPLTHITGSPTPWTSGEKRDLVRHWGWATRMWRLARGARRGRSIPLLSRRRSPGQTGRQVTLLQMAAFYVIQKYKANKNLNWIEYFPNLTSLQFFCVFKMLSFEFYPDHRV